MKKLIPPVLLLVLFILAWDLVVRFDMVNAYLLPMPKDVLVAFLEVQADLIHALNETFRAALYGLGYSLLLGFALAVIFQFVPYLEKAFMPFAIFFQTVPIIAIAPLLVIWFGFGMPTVKASAFIVSFFPILANTMVGLKSTPFSLLELFKLYRSNPFQLFFKLTLPYSVPYILAGFKVSAGLAIVGAIVGEFVGGGGLGALIDSARTQQRTDIVLAAVILAASLGLLMLLLTEILNYILIKKLRFGRVE